MKKILSILLVLCMMPVSFSSAETVETVGGYTWEELKQKQYMSLDQQTSYPMNREVFDSSKIPAAEEIATAFENLSHPYVIADDEAFARIRALKTTDPYIKKWYEAAEAKGISYLSVTASAYKVSSGALSSNTDDASMLLAFLYQTCDDEVQKEKYAKKACYFLEAAANYPDFNPSKMLNVGEMSRGTGLAYDWLYNWMSENCPDKLTAIEEGLLRNSVEYMSTHTYSNTNNWNFVVNGGSIVAAVALGKLAPETAATAIRNCAQRLPNAMRLYYPDGGFIEASGYFGYASSYLGPGLAALNSVFGTDWGLSDIEGFSQNGYFPIYTKGYTNEQAIAYGDGTMAAVYSPLLLWQAEKFDNSDFGMYQREGTNNDLFSILWYNPERYVNARPLSALPNDYYSGGSIPYASMREDWTTEEGLFAGIKGGYNQESHGDLDIGTFYIGSGGKSFTKELQGVDYHSSSSGAPLPYFDLTRYTYYAKSPQGHNTLTINQSAHYPDMSFGQNLSAHCDFSDFYSSDNEAYAILDMTQAYIADAEKVNRGLKLDRENFRIIISDYIVTDKESDVWWFMHTDADIEVNGKSAKLTLDGKELYADIISDTDAEFIKMDAVALPNTPTVEGFDDVVYKGEQKLAVNFKVNGAEELQICFTEVEDNAAEFLSLNDWSKTKNSGYKEKPYFTKKTLSAYGDAYSELKNPDSNYAQGGLNIKKSKSHEREAFIKFKDTDVNTDAESVKLTVHAIKNYADNGNSYADEIISLYGTSLAWDEYTLTWNNKPEITGETISQQTVHTNGTISTIDEYITFDVTNYYNSLEDKSELSFAIKLTSRNNGSVVIESKESGLAPKLDIQYKKPQKKLITPSDDAHADEYHPDSVSTGFIVLKNNTSPYHRNGYLKFKDAAVLEDAEISSVKLKMHAVRNYANGVRKVETLSLYEASTEWSEETLTWNNVPSASGTVIAQATVTDVIDDVINEYIEFDITEYYKSLTNKETLSFLLKLTSGKGGGVYLTSKERGSAPTIEITYNRDVREVKLVSDAENPFIAVVNRENGILQNISLCKAQNGKTEIICDENTDGVYVWDESMSPLDFLSE